MTPAAGYTKRRHRWTREAVVAKLREWQETYGEPPSATDWNPSDCLSSAQRSAERARAWALRSERFHEGEWPWTGSVYKLFGGWNSALREAGLEVRWAGKRQSPIGHEEGGALDSDELRSLVDVAEAHMVAGSSAPLRSTLLELAERALAWAGEIPDD